jgi:hypothetical protein
MSFIDSYIHLEIQRSVLTSERMLRMWYMECGLITLLLYTSILVQVQFIDKWELNNI